LYEKLLGKIFKRPLNNNIKDRIEKNLKDLLK
jgi:hypothetical protein